MVINGPGWKEHSINLEKSRVILVLVIFIVINLISKGKLVRVHHYLRQEETLR